MLKEAEFSQGVWGGRVVSTPVLAGVGALALVSSQYWNCLFVCHLLLVVLGRGTQNPCHLLSFS